jgi:hypothetical protein
LLLNDLMPVPLLVLLFEVIAWKHQNTLLS